MGLEEKLTVPPCVGAPKLYIDVLVVVSYMAKKSSRLIRSWTCTVPRPAVPGVNTYSYILFLAILVKLQI
jgi:hypothetical protein